MIIPFLSTPDKPIVATTQFLLPLADIVDNLAIYKNGAASLIMESTSLNFSLLSEKEQQAVIASYAGLLNSFKFSVQIAVRSLRRDITSYINFLDENEKNVKSAQLKVLMDDHKRFIIEAIKKKNVLSKKFYIVIPFTPYELGISKSIISTFRMPAQQQDPLPFPKSYVIRKAKIALLPKRDHLIRQAQRLTIHLHHLNNEELIELFYNIYNPEPPVKEEDVFGQRI